MKSKICGISDLKTLEYLTNHLSPPEFIGFIVNFPKSKRYVKIEKLNELLKINKKKTSYVAVLVKPDRNILEKIKNLPFDYYQLYNCNPDETESIKKEYNIKIITAFTIQNAKDIMEYKLFKSIADIYLFDSKGYEKSLRFDHSLIKNLKFDKEVMLAGDIKINDNLENYKKITDIIDISGGLETSGLKDISKIDIFLNKMKQVNDEA
jgi:phosphoribosylanthranilate isomerase